MITIPTLSELYNGILNDLQSEYGSPVPNTQKNVLRCIAAVQAAKLKLKYLYLGSIQKNIWVDTADSEENGGTLERFGRIKLGRNKQKATAGIYTLVVSGETGATIPASTTFKSDDDSLNPGYLFILEQAYQLTGPTDTITVRALTAGLESKLEANDTLTATAPIASVDSGAYVQSIDTQPLAAETVEQYRATLNEAFRLEPQGGAASDYRIWCQDAQGVERVYPYARSGYTAEVNLYVEATPEDSIDGYGTPSAQILTDVEDVVNFNPDQTIPLLERGRRPLQVIVNYLPVTPIPVVITITNYAGLTLAKQATLLAALEEMISGIRPFVAAADVLINKNDIISNNQIIGVIVTAIPGSSFDAPVFTVGGIPYQSHQFLDGDIPYLSAFNIS